jgi:hypothetical protein
MNHFAIGRQNEQLQKMRIAAHDGAQRPGFVR